MMLTLRKTFHVLLLAGMCSSVCWQVAAVERSAVGGRNIQSLQAAGMQLNATKSAVDAAVGVLLDRIALLEGRFDDLDITYDNLDSRITLTENEIDALTVRVTNLETRMDTAEADVLWLKGQILILEARLSVVEELADAIQESLDDLDSRTDGVESRLASVDADLADLKQRVAALEAKGVVNELPPPDMCGDKNDKRPISNGSIWRCQDDPPTCTGNQSTPISDGLGGWSGCTPAQPEQSDDQPPEPDPFCCDSP